MSTEFANLLQRSALASAVSNESHEELGLLDLVSLEAETFKICEELTNTIRFSRIVESISTENHTPDSYEACMSIVFESFGKSEYANLTFPSNESRTDGELYFTEAETKKQGLGSRLWDLIKKLWAILKEKFKTLFGMKKTVVDGLKKQQDDVEKAAAATGYDFSKLAANDPVTADDKPTPAPAAPKIKIGYPVGHKIRVGFLSNDLSNVASNAIKLAAAGEDFVEESFRVTEKVIAWDYEKGSNIRDELPNGFTTFYKVLDLSSGTKIVLRFYYMGGAVDVITHTPKEIEVLNLSEVPVKKLLDARSKLIEVMEKEVSYLPKYKSTLARLDPIFTKILAERNRLQEYSHKAEWEEVRPQWLKQEAVMRNLEAMLGFINSSSYGYTSQYIKPAIDEVSRCLGIRGGFGILK